MGRLAVVIAAAVFVVAGCGKARYVAPPAAPKGECDRFAHGAAVNVFVAGAGAEDLCAEITQKWSGPGIFWSREGSRRVGDNDTVICAMTNGDATIVVFDIAGGSIGERQCGELAAAGWTETEPIGPGD